MNSPLRFRSRIFLSAIVLTLLATNCGGGSGSSSQSAVGPNAILNGSALSIATSYWHGNNCFVPLGPSGLPADIEVELTGDGGLKNGLVDESGITYTTLEGWTSLGSNGLTASINGTPTMTLTNIAGSTSSQNFSAGVGFPGQQSVMACTFTLVTGKLP